MAVLLTLVGSVGMVVVEWRDQRRFGVANTPDDTTAKPYLAMAMSVISAFVLILAVNAITELFNGDPAVWFAFPIALVGAGACIAIQSGAIDRLLHPTVDAAAPPQPAGHTADGQPFYPIVGYTPDGRSIAADQAPGYRPPATGTNSKAITAFVLAFTFAILAIPFGHMARTEIRRTGEQGAGLALAALIIGYINVALLIAGGIALAVILAQA